MRIAKVVPIVLILVLATPASAQVKFVEKFLNRYRPTVEAVPPAAMPQGQNITDLIRSGVLPLSVGDMIRLILENNLDVHVNRFSPVSSGYLIDSLYRPFDPSLRVSATVDRSTSPSRSQLTGAPALGQLAHSYQVGYSQALPTGTNFGVDFSLQRFSSNSAFNSFNPSWVGLVRYSANQHLLRDRGREVNMRQIRVAQNNKRISEYQFERQMIDLVAQAQRVYWDLVFSQEDIKVKQRSLDLATKTLEDNRKQVEIGTLAPIEVVQAESEVATRLEQLVISTHNQDVAGDQIKKLLSTYSDPGMVLAKLQPIDTVPRPGAFQLVAVAEAIRVAIENRPEMKQLELELRNKTIDVMGARNAMLPTLDLLANYTQNGLGGIETLRSGFGPGAPIIAVHRGGLGDTFSQLFGFDFTGYSLGFSLNIPLGNKPAQSDHARAVNERRLGESRLAATSQQIALDVRNAYSQVEMNRARIEAAQKARELTERRLEAEQKKFELGASTIRFVLEEQRNVAQAQTNEIQSLVNHTKALVDLDRAMGRTLQRNNIEIEKVLQPKIAN